MDSLAQQIKNGNAGQIPNRRMSIINLQQDMEAFDSLPKILRDKLNYIPGQYQAIGLLHFWRKNGTQAAIQLIEDNIRRYFPNWTNING